MAKLEWFNTVAKVLRAQADGAVFPGDPDPVMTTLERLADKLLGECMNGEPYGTDGCVACRAFRTESAEAQAAKDAKARKDAEGVIEILKADLEASQHAFQVTDEARKLVNGANEELEDAVKHAQVTVKDALTARDEALAERASAQRQAEDAKAQVESFQKRFEALNSKFERARQIVQQFPEVF
jgi:hypothetical protein